MSERICGASAPSQKIPADVAHVQHADVRLVDVRHQHAIDVQHGELQRVRRAREAAAAMPPRAGEHGEARQRAELHRAVAMVLDADERPQERRLRRRVLAGEALDLAGRQADRMSATRAGA